MTLVLPSIIILASFPCGAHMNDLTKKVLVASGVFLIGLAIGRFTLPAKVVVKEVVKTEIVEVEKKDTATQNNKVQIVTETKKPDGTVVTETKTVDKSTIETKDDTNTNTNIVSNKETTTEYSKS